MQKSREEQITVVFRYLMYYGAYLPTTETLWVKVVLPGEGENKAKAPAAGWSRVCDPVMALNCICPLLCMPALDAGCWKGFQISPFFCFKSNLNKQNNTEGKEKTPNKFNLTSAPASKRKKNFFLVLPWPSLLCFAVKESRTPLMPVLPPCFALLGL